MARRGFRQIVTSLVVVTLASLVAMVGPAGAQTGDCPVSSADLAIDSEEQQLLALINQYRADNDLIALAMDPSVTRAAAWFSRDMASNDYFPPDHVDRNNRNIPQRLAWCQVSFQAWAENIYAGSPDAEVVFEAWKNSPVHNTNMLRPEVNLAGIARAFDAAAEFDWYWTLDLTSPGGPATGVVQGSTWYSDGTRTKSGPVGTQIRAYAVNAAQGTPYKLVLGTGTPTRACQAIVQVLNPATVFAAPSGILGRVTGTVQPGIPPGTYKLCFEDSSTGNLTGTGGATFTVTG